MAAGGKACGLARGVDAPDVHRYRREPAQTHNEDRDQRRHRERRFDRGAAALTG
ncbi:DNA polymerase iota [Mycolicibacterium novocastrense]|uniref:DNA polymerase iota n=1 Tax=Mycolicibacterium novocastrense TaxID=59813 RepID=A0ABQ0KQ05_MYCNV|nr:DNA polymerase iota [Mycolicibacterium novocastrense]